MAGTWSAITSTNTASIQSMITAMTAFHPYYSTLTVAQVQTAMNNHSQVKAFLYSDGSNVGAVIVTPNPDWPSINVYMMGYSGPATAAQAASVFAAKVFTEMGVYGYQYIWGTCPKDVSTTAKAIAFYTALPAALTAAGFFAVFSNHPSQADGNQWTLEGVTSSTGGLIQSQITGLPLP